MTILAKQAERYIDSYVRAGAKENRKIQVKRINDFLNWIEVNEKLTSLNQLGKKQVIRYWKAHADMNEATAYKYWLGIGKLWKWLGKPEDPPRPRKELKLMSRLDNSEETLTYLGMLLSGSGCPEQTRETNAENNSRVQNGIYAEIPERIPERPDTIIYDIQNGQQPAQSPVKTMDTLSSDMESKNNIPPASVIIPYKALEAIRFILLSVKNKENEGIIKRYLDTAVKHHSKRSQQQT